MALHGLIQVNGRTIGEWQAQRITGGPGELCTYECTVRTKTDGKWQPQPLHFILDHHYDVGAVALAARVLVYAASPAYRKHVEAGEQG